MKRLLLTFLLLVSQLAPAQTMLVDAPNVYSPHLQNINGRLKMYFGGWTDPGQTNDKIYRSDCPTPDHCNFEQSVVFLENGVWTDRPAGIDLVNDPAVVNMGSYLILYMTVCRNAPACTDSGAANSIYYSVSLATDGLHWTSPMLLTDDAWLPSAVLRSDGNVWLYANNGHNGALFYMNLGPAGTAISSRMLVNVNSFVNYVNTEVRYYPAFNQYVMVGEQNGVGVIDALISNDGANFNMVRPAIAGPVSGWPYVRTPATHPDNVCWLYAAATQDNRYGEGNKIFVKPLCAGSL